MEEIIKYLEEIKKHQMQTVQLARSTEVYKLADKALAKALLMHGVVKPLYCQCDEPYEQRLPHSTKPYCGECSRNIKQ
jgi:hypothetical protein